MVTKKVLYAQNLCNSFNDDLTSSKSYPNSGLIMIVDKRIIEVIVTKVTIK